MIRYKLDVITELNRMGINFYSIKEINKGKPFSQNTYNRLKKRQPVSFDTLDTLCSLFHCRIEDIIEYIPDNTDTDA